MNLSEPKLLLQTVSSSSSTSRPRFFVLFVCGVCLPGRRRSRRCHAEKSGQLGIIDGPGDNLFPKNDRVRRDDLLKSQNCGLA